MISFPIAILSHLLDMNRDIGSLNFSLKNTSQIKSILPNKKVVKKISKKLINYFLVY